MLNLKLYFSVRSDIILGVVLVMTFFEKNIFINPYISSRTYNIWKPDSRSYVVNERSQSEFLFEGITSDLWNVILGQSPQQNHIVSDESDFLSFNNIRSCSSEFLRKFVEDNSLQDEIEDFLEELYFSDLIIYGDPEELYEDILMQNTKLTLLSDREEMQKFAMLKKKYLYENEFLYSACFKYSEKTFDLDLARKILKDLIKIGTNLIVIDVRGSKLDSNFFLFARIIRENYVSLEIIIDGDSLLQENILFEKISNLYPHRIKIPLFSIDSDKHDYIYGKVGNYKNTIYSIERLIGKNVPVNIIYQEKNGNERDMQDIVDYSCEMGVEFSCDDSLADKNSDIINLVNDDYISINDEHKNTWHFLARQKLFISPDFELFYDSDLKNKISSLKNTSIVDVWYNIIIK